MYFSLLLWAHERDLFVVPRQYNSDVILFYFFFVCIQKITIYTHGVLINEHNRTGLNLYSWPAWKVGRRWRGGWRLVELRRQRRDACRQCRAWGCRTRSAASAKRAPHLSARPASRAWNKCWLSAYRALHPRTRGVADPPPAPRAPDWRATRVWGVACLRTTRSSPAVTTASAVAASPV